MPHATLIDLMTELVDMFHGRQPDSVAARCQPGADRSDRFVSGGREREREARAGILRNSMVSLIPRSTTSNSQVCMAPTHPLMPLTHDDLSPRR